MNKTLKPIALKTGNDAEAAAQFIHSFNDAQNALPRVVSFGVLAIDFKLNRLKHGQFLPWIASVCPADRKPENFIRCVQGHVNLTENVLKEAGIQIRDAFRICHGGKLLLLPEGEIPDGSKSVRDKIFAIIDGKSARQLFSEFKQPDDREEHKDNPVPKRGRLKGHGGATAAQRAAAQAAEETARITRLTLESGDWIRWIKQNSDDERLGKVPDAIKVKLFEANRLLGDYLRPFVAAKKGGDR